MITQHPWWDRPGYRIEFVEQQESGTDTRIGFKYDARLPRVGERVHLYGKGGPATGQSYSVIAVGYQYVNGALVDDDDDLRHPTEMGEFWGNHAIVQVVKFSSVKEVVRAIDLLRQRLELLRTEQETPRA